MKNNNDINKILTLTNWNRWHELLIKESSGLEGMRELIGRGIKKEFKIKDPDSRVPAIMEGVGMTPKDRKEDGTFKYMRDGYLIDDKGDFKYFNVEQQKLNNDKYFYERKQIDSQRLRYENSIRAVIKYISVNISSQIEEKLKALGESYEDLVMKEDLPGMLKVIKKIATGRGANSIVLESQTLIRMKMSGETDDDVIKTINKFKESVDQLRYERSDKQVLEGLIDGLFVCIFAKCKSLENQIERIYEETEYPNYKKLADKLMNVLE